MTKNQELEIKTWKQLCHMLKDGGAVTQDDLNKSRSACDTPGTILLQQIRLWGKCYAEIIS